MARPRGPCHPRSPPSNWPCGTDSHTGLSPYVPTRVCQHPAKPKAPTRVLGLAQGPTGQPRPQERSGPLMTRPSWVMKNPWSEPSRGFGPGCWALAHTHRGAANPTTRLGESSRRLWPGPDWSRPSQLKRGGQGH